MKKTILTTLIAAGISTAPLANELAKLKFATDSGAQTPAQQTAVSEKVAQKSASSKAEEDTIPELIFDQTDIRQLAVLTPDEMAQTEGAWIPLAYAAWTLGAGAVSAWMNHAKHQYTHGEWASVESTAFATGVGMLGAGHGKAISQAAGLTGWQAAKVNLGGAAISTVGSYGNPFNTSYDWNFGNDR